MVVARQLWRTSIHPRNLLALSLFPLSALLWAQNANPYDGTWRVELKMRNGGSIGGEAIIAGQQGSWDMEGSSTNNPCAGRKAPIAVKEATPELLTLEVQGSKALTGCDDYVLRFKPVDAQTLEGTVGAANRPIKLTRK